MRIGFPVPTCSKALLALCLLLTGLAPARAQVQSSDVTLTAADGVQLKASFFAATKPGPGVLLLHMCGNGGRKPWNNVAMMLASNGFHVLTLDYRGFGESGGPRFQELPDAQRRPEQTKWPSDFDLAFAYLLARPGVDKERIGAGGASCGVDNSIQLAIRHPQVRSLLLLSGGTDQEGLNFLQQADRLPIFAASSEDDFDSIPYMHWLLLFSRNPMNKLVEYKKAGHGTDMFTAEKGLEPKIVEWFVRTLKDAPTVHKAGKAAKVKPNPMVEFWSLLNGPDGAARALQALREAKRRNPNVVLFPVLAVMTLGYRRLQNNDVQGAVEVLQLGIEAYPNSALLYYSLGAVYLEAGDFEKAIKYTESTLEILDKDSTLSGKNKDSIRQRAEGRLSKLRQPPPQEASGYETSAPQPALMVPCGQVLQMLIHVGDAM